MDEKTKELIDKLLLLLSEYHKIFIISDLVQILETVKNIEVTYFIKTKEQKEKDFEKIIPKEIDVNSFVNG